MLRKIENPQERILDRAKIPEGVRFAAATALAARIPERVRFAAATAAHERRV